MAKVTGDLREAAQKLVENYFDGANLVNAIRGIRAALAAPPPETCPNCGRPGEKFLVCKQEEAK